MESTLDKEVKHSQKIQAQTKRNLNKVWRRPPMQCGCYWETGCSCGLWIF